jgi:hypothetical protein
MRIDLTNKYTMYTGLDAFFTLNAVKIALIDALVEFVAEFKTLLAQITNADKQVTDSTAGTTDTKSAAERALVTSMITVGGRLFVYANVNNDAALKEKYNFSKTTLYRTRDIALVDIAVALYQDATAVLAQLAKYNITADLLTDLNTKTEAYKNAIGAQGSGKSQHSSALVNVVEVFHSIDALLNDKIDPLIVSLEQEQPAFCREYKQTRAVKDLGGSHKTKTETPATPSGGTTAAAAGTPAKP